MARVDCQFESQALNLKYELWQSPITKNLIKEGIYFVAFDIIGDFISEVNITCPGLMVEVSEACKKNLAEEMIKELWVQGKCFL